MSGTLPETVSRRIRITGMAATTQPPIETINVQYQVVTDIVPPSQPMRPGLPMPVIYAGSIALTRQEVKKLNLAIGDEITIILTP
jgi:hypothetical protein